MGGGLTHTGEGEGVDEHQANSLPECVSNQRQVVTHIDGGPAKTSTGFKRLCASQSLTMAQDEVELLWVFYLHQFKAQALAAAGHGAH